MRNWKRILSVLLGGAMMASLVLGTAVYIDALEGDASVPVAGDAASVAVGAALGDEAGDVPVFGTGDEPVVSGGIIQEELSLSYPEAQMSYFAEIPESYDPRTLGTASYVSSVKNQGANGLCWAFSHNGLVETYMMKQAYDAGGALSAEPDFSEVHIAHALSNSGGNAVEGFERLPSDGGNRYMTAIYMMRGTDLSGMVNEEDDEAFVPSVELAERPLAESLGKEKSYRVQNVMFLNGETKPTGTEIDVLKQAIMEYGAVGTSMYELPAYFDDTMTSYYLDTQYWFTEDQLMGNHAVLLVGWDDKYSRENFNADKALPSADGAWLVKNSWGTGIGEDGYIWISYEDTNFPISNYVVYGVEEYNEKERVYEYDYRTQMAYMRSSASGTKTRYYARVYETETSTERLEAVRIFIGGANTTVDFDVISDFASFDGYAFAADGEIDATLEAVYPGWYTVELAAPVELTDADGDGKAMFAVAIRLQTDDSILITYDHNTENPAAVSDEAGAPATAYNYVGGVWNKYAYNICLKAITLDEFDISLGSGSSGGSGGGSGSGGSGSSSGGNSIGAQLASGGAISASDFGSTFMYNDLYYSPKAWVGAGDGPGPRASAVMAADGAVALAADDAAMLAEASAADDAAANNLDLDPTAYFITGSDAVGMTGEELGLGDLSFAATYKGEEVSASDVEITVSGSALSEWTVSRSGVYDMVYSHDGSEYATRKLVVIAGDFGDVNGDRNVNIIDRNYLKGMLLAHGELATTDDVAAAIASMTAAGEADNPLVTMGEQELRLYLYRICDVNHDGSVTEADAGAILNRMNNTLEGYY